MQAKSALDLHTLFFHRRCHFFERKMEREGEGKGFVEGYLKKVTRSNTRFNLQRKLNTSRENDASAQNRAHRTRFANEEAINIDTYD